MRWQATVVGDDPDSQVADALRTMAAYVREDYRHPLVEEHARLARRLGRGDPITGAYLLARSAIPFREDQITGAFAQSLYGLPVIEVFVRPLDMAISCSSGQCLPGDCDDFSMYVAALLAANGVEPRFAVVAADPRLPGRWSHVYVVAYPEEPWNGMLRVPVDASHGPWPGWEYPPRNRLLEYPIFGGSRELVWPAVSLAAIVCLTVLIYRVRERRCISGW